MPPPLRLAAPVGIRDLREPHGPIARFVMVTLGAFIVLPFGALGWALAVDARRAASGRSGRGRSAEGLRRRGGHPLRAQPRPGPLSGDGRRPDPELPLAAKEARGQGDVTRRRVQPGDGCGTNAGGSQPPAHLLRTTSHRSLSPLGEKRQGGDRGLWARVCRTSFIGP